MVELATSFCLNALGETETKDKSIISNDKKKHKNNYYQKHLKNCEVHDTTSLT